MNQDPILTATEIKFILWAFISLIGILAWIGKQGIGYLKSMSISMTNMEKELSVLANDHSNLKDDHKELKVRVGSLEQKFKYNGNGQ